MVYDPTTVRTKELRKPTKEQHYYATNLDMLLTHDEIIDLTGYRQPKKQCEFLLKHGILYLPGRDARPRVSRAAVESLLGSRGRRLGPNVNALRDRLSRGARNG